jgi:hypothetical protein
MNQPYNEQDALFSSIFSDGTGLFRTPAEPEPGDDVTVRLRIQRDAEARVWRNFKYGGASGANSIDYDALGGVMRDNVSAGGNVYLDGRTVGRVISASQANSFRNLERSGWQG